MKESEITFPSIRHFLILSQHLNETPLQNLRKNSSQKRHIIFLKMFIKFTSRKPEFGVFVGVAP